MVEDEVPLFGQLPQGDKEARILGSIVHSYYTLE